jgi:isopentenyl diphosphate isomerase/L-lactate dehydrogenase-like FMN-dependent dehydrogenase
MISINNNTLQDALGRRQALKVISGLQNFDQHSVSRIVRSAERGGATYVDVAAHPDLVKVVRSQSDLPICVSAVDPEQLAIAVQAGADLVEIGNFDSFYEAGRVFTAAEVLDLARKTRAMLPRTLLSVTVPHTLTLDQQAELAEKLETIGADLIQTEGGTSAQPQHSGSLGLVEKAAPTLAAAYEISRAVTIPVLCASGLSTVTVAMAIAAGASGVGVGRAVSQLQDEVAMVAQVRALVEALNKAVIPVAYSARS